MKESKIKYNMEHGSPYDRGSADAWYSRKKDPHWYPQGTGRGERISCLDMTPLQLEAYNAGYDNEDGRKEYQ
jgi:hypothetical protein